MMVWADLKALIALSYCRNKNEVIESIFDYKKTQKWIHYYISTKYTEILKVHPNSDFK